MHDRGEVLRKLAGRAGWMETIRDVRLQDADHSDALDVYCEQEFRGYAGGELLFVLPPAVISIVGMTPSALRQLGRFCLESADRLEDEAVKQKQDVQAGDTKER